MRRRKLHAIANKLRILRLISVIDLILFIKNIIINRKANRNFIMNHPAFPIPPRHLAFDAHGEVDWYAYYNSGKEQAKIVGNIINEYVINDNIKVCKWGCGPARIIRHLRDALKHKNVELYGSDYNTESIEWCRKNILGIDFRSNQLYPPLPFADDSFDCVYAISVFTHLSEKMHFLWIKELERLLKTDGIIIITTHSDLSVDRLLAPEKKLHESGKLVVRGQVKEGKKWYLAYHPPAFVRNELLKGWEIKSHTQFSKSQDIWVAKRS